MIWIISGALLAGAIVFLILEARGKRTTISLSFKGDLKRESAFLQQYGQSVCTPLVAWLAGIAARDWRPFVLVCAAVLANSFSVFILKKLFGRVRPNRENAGKFTGFSFKHDNKKESFPSSHSACAFALSAALIQIWPEAAIVWWTLAGLTAFLRYAMEAHFPSDILAGCAWGLVVGHTTYIYLAQLLGQPA
ncbi:MAG TPA: phosphatase PAP2 family protein [Tepidisphaeraceae bacterium]|nr:phosphatase PAP2 family protein [Tepidisphaeraceae bacterium]